MNLVSTRGLGASLRLVGQPDLPVTVLVRHRAADPGLLQVVVVLSDDDSFELPLDRGLLTDGIAAPVAEGDVSVSVGGDQVLVQVADLGLVLGLVDVIDVLLESYATSPTGSERDVVITLTAARELLQA